MTWTQRRRHQIAWFCAAVALWMPWDAQLHGLWHARQALHDAVSRTFAPLSAARSDTLSNLAHGDARQNVAGGDAFVLSAHSAVESTGARNAALPHVAKLCEQCLLFSALNAALPSHAIALAAVDEAPPAPMLVVRQRDAAPFTAYQSRAPPRRA